MTDNNISHAFTFSSKLDSVIGGGGGGGGGAVGCGAKKICFKIGLFNFS